MEVSLSSAGFQFEINDLHGLSCVCTGHAQIVDVLLIVMTRARFSTRELKLVFNPLFLLE